MTIGTAIERFKNEVRNNYKSGSYDLPIIFQTCDSFAIDSANRKWDLMEKKAFLRSFLFRVRPLKTATGIVTKFMRDMPHRLLRYCFKANSTLGISSLFILFLNFSLYCCMGIDSATINAGNPSELDGYQALDMLRTALSEVHEAIKKDFVENYNAAKADSVVAEADTVVAEVDKLTLAESTEQQTQEKQNDSPKAQTGKAKALFKGIIGFGAFIALCSAGLPPHVVTPVINTAVEKAF